jgi:hypothetical protein
MFYFGFELVSEDIFFGSSASIRIAGVKVSSYCPLRTDHTNAPTNTNPTVRLAKIKRMMTLMIFGAG